jgi:hypothetical protein
VPRVTGIAIIALFILLNLRGVGVAGGVEILLVWFKVIALLGLASWGLIHWDPPALSRGVPEANLLAALFGAASVFMAYEGFQLLTYDYEDIDNPKRTLPLAVLSAIVVVILIYVTVALGTTMLIGADQVIAHKEVALAIAGEKAFGTVGLVLVTIAAAFSTGSAINATLFATARLAHRVATDGELPAAVDHHNRLGVPDRAVVGLGIIAAVLVATGSLIALVEAASLTFLFTFAVVCTLAFRLGAGHRLITGFGALAGALACIALVVQLLQSDPLALVFLGVLVVIALFGRPLLLRKLGTRQP